MSKRRDLIALTIFDWLNSEEDSAGKPSIYNAGVIAQLWIGVDGDLDCVALADVIDAALSKNPIAIEMKKRDGIAEVFHHWHAQAIAKGAPVKMFDDPEFEMTPDGIIRRIRPQGTQAMSKTARDEMAKAIREVLWVHGFKDAAGEWDDITDDARSTWRWAAQAAQQAVDAAGFVIVPKEPTDEMLVAGGYHDADIVYRAMIAAVSEAHV